MSSFTLIIPTIGDAATLPRLLSSLAQQEVDSLECVVVDQNPDDRLDQHLDRWRPRLKIRRLRSAPGASRARNVGLSRATGDIIAFPDDDCWYSSGLLSAVDAWFSSHAHFGILTVGALDQHGMASGNRWFQRRCEIHPVNAFRTTFCSSIFIRRSVACGATCFDEALGPGAGTGWSSGDETDFVLNLQKAGTRAFFDRRLHVGHPRRDMLSGNIDSPRAESYGRGMGFVLGKHSLYGLGGAFIFYDLLRSFLVGIRGDRLGMALCFYHARGIAFGIESYNAAETS